MTTTMTPICIFDHAYSGVSFNLQELEIFTHGLSDSGHSIEEANLLEWEHAEMDYMNRLVDYFDVISSACRTNEERVRIATAISHVFLHRGEETPFHMVTEEMNISNPFMTCDHREVVKEPYAEYGQAYLNYCESFDNDSGYPAPEGFLFTGHDSVGCHTFFNACLGMMIHVGKRSLSNPRFWVTGMPEDKSEIATVLETDSWHEVLGFVQ